MRIARIPDGVEADGVDLRSTPKISDSSSIVATTRIQSLVSNMDSFAIFRTIIYKWLRSIERPLGHDIFDPDYKINMKTMIFALYSVSFSLCYLRTIFYFDGDIRIEAIAYSGIGLQVMRSYMTMAPYRTLLFIPTRN